jgi:ubiquinone/menaquinone biosynthesis C-methylase UbiE
MTVFPSSSSLMGQRLAASKNRRILSIMLSYVGKGTDEEMTEHSYQREVFLNSEGDNYFERNLGAFSLDLPQSLKKPLEFYSRYLKPNHKVLEIGCSSGHNLHYFHTRVGCSCFGIDPSKKAVGFGREHFPEVQFSVGTAESLEFADNSFDFVLFGFCLYMVDRPLLPRVVAEADRVLKDQSFLGITDFDPPSPFQRPYKHKEGVKIYKMDYSKLFTVYPNYIEVEKICFSHASLDFAIDPQERVSSLVLFKDEDAGYQYVD